jgi:hypothetical protein
VVVLIAAAALATAVIFSKRSGGEMAGPSGTEPEAEPRS